MKRYNLMNNTNDQAEFDSLIKRTWNDAKFSYGKVDSWWAYFDIDDGDWTEDNEAIMVDDVEEAERRIKAIWIVG